MAAGKRPAIAGKGRSTVIYLAPATNGESFRTNAKVCYVERPNVVRRAAQRGPATSGPGGRVRPVLPIGGVWRTPQSELLGRNIRDSLAQEKAPARMVRDGGNVELPAT